MWIKTQNGKELIEVNKVKYFKSGNKYYLVGCQKNDVELTILKLLVEEIIFEENRIILKVKSDNSSEVNYVVYITEDTECDIDFKTLELGTKLNIEASEVLCSHPMQAYPSKVFK